MFKDKDITFVEHKEYGYKPRTTDNAGADATIAIAIDFNSAGERLTKKEVLRQGKLYIPIDVSEKLEIRPEEIEAIKSLLKKYNVQTLNIAGNGIYTMQGKYSQSQLDFFVHYLVSWLDVKHIRTGGQTGVDEAGAKAGARLGIPTTVLAPRGWKFRNEFGKDISDEKQFKQRFL